VRVARSCIRKCISRCVVVSDHFPQLKATEVVRAFERLGFIFRRHTGSHMILRNPSTKKTVSIPVHAGDIKRGLLFGLLKQSGVDRDEFLTVL